MQQNVDVLEASTPPSSVIVAHSAGAVPVFLALQSHALSPTALVLVEPGLYDIARGDDAIERHIELMTRARTLSSHGDLFGYWSIVRPLMFGGEAERTRWEAERGAAARFEAKQPPWGFPVAASAIDDTPTLVLTGDWNGEYEAIARILEKHGAIHRHLRGKTHRPQDHPDFEATVEGFLRNH